MTKVYLICFSVAFLLFNVFFLLRYWGLVKYENESDEDYLQFLSKPMSKKIKYRLILVVFMSIFTLLYILIKF